MDVSELNVMPAVPKIKKNESIGFVYLKISFIEYTCEKNDSFRFVGYKYRL